MEALFVLTAIILVVVIFSRLSALTLRIEAIERRQGVMPAPQPSWQAQPEPSWAPQSAEPSREPQPPVLWDLRPEQVRPQVEPWSGPLPRVDPATPEIVEEPVLAAALDEPPPPDPAATPRASAATPSVPRIDWEIFAGGRFFNVAGAIVLIVGVGLFMKYAFDQGWIGAPLRVLIGVLAGSGLLAVGAVVHKAQREAGRAWFVDGVFGAGLGTLYVTAYAALEGFHLVTFGGAFAFMAAVTAVAMIIALRYESLPVALIGWFGGYVTPFSIGVGNISESGLGTYLVLLDLGLVGAALVRRTWYVLTPLATGASYLVAAVWFAYHLQTSPVVSTIALTGMWLVFFSAGVVSTMRDRAAGVERPLHPVVELANAALYWVGSWWVLGDQRGAFAVVELVAAGAYACSYAFALRRFPDINGLRGRYLAVSLAFLAGAMVTRLDAAELTLAFVLIALGAGVVAALLARAAEVPQAAREATFAAFCYWAAAGFAYIPHPTAFVHSASWALDFSSRDLALIAFVTSGFALDRLTRRALSSEAHGFAFRQGALFALVSLFGLHWSGFALANAYVGIAVALAVVDRALRACGTSYARDLEAPFATLFLFLMGAAAFFGTSQSLASVIGPFDLQTGSRDLTLIWAVVAGYAIDRSLRGNARAQALGTLFRALSLMCLVVLAVMHVDGLGLTSAFAVMSILLLTLDRMLAAAGTSYGTPREVAICSGVLIALAWCAALASGSPYLGPHIALGFGGADSTVLALALAPLVTLRFLRSVMPAPLAVGFRQAGVLALAWLAPVHFTGLGIAAALAGEGLLFAFAGTRLMLRDLEVDGLLGLGLAVVIAFVHPDAWQAPDLAAFIPFRDPRGIALPVVATAAVIAGEMYRRYSLLPAWVGRAVRLAGVATLIFGLTGEMRDFFERQILTADPVAVETLRSTEGLLVSGLWIASSVAIILAGVRLRIKEFRVGAIVLFDLTILKAFFVDLSSLAAPYRILSFIGLGLTLLAVSYVYQRLERGDTGANPPPPEPEPVPTGA